MSCHPRRRTSQWRTSRKSRKSDKSVPRPRQVGHKGLSHSLSCRLLRCNVCLSPADTFALPFCLAVTWLFFFLTAEQTPIICLFGSRFSASHLVPSHARYALCVCVCVCACVCACVCVRVCVCPRTHTHTHTHTFCVASQSSYCAVLRATYRQMRSMRVRDYVSAKPGTSWESASPHNFQPCPTLVPLRAQARACCASAYKSDAMRTVTNSPCKLPAHFKRVPHANTHTHTHTHTRHAAAGGGASFDSDDDFPLAIASKAVEELPGDQESSDDGGDIDSPSAPPRNCLTNAAVTDRLERVRPAPPHARRFSSGLSLHA
jgi:hypothetical protein